MFVILQQMLAVVSSLILEHKSCCKSVLALVTNFKNILNLDI
jgi:hypothetical protein